MKRKLLKKPYLGLLLGIGLISSGLFGNTLLEVKTIAISQIIEHEALNETYRGIIEELEAEGYVGDKKVKIVYETAQGSPLIAAQIAQKFVSIQPDVMVGIGTIAAQALVGANKRSGKPIVFSSVTDPVGAQLVASLSEPGAGVTGVTNWIKLEPQIEKFQQILPKLKRLGIVYNPGEGNSVILVSRLKDTARQMGIEITESPATATMEVGMAAKHIAHKVDAFFISNDNTVLSAFESVVGVANDAGIPVFVSDINKVQSGAVAALGPDQYEIGRQTGKMIVEILKGTSPAKMPVEFPKKTEFYLNLDALKRLHIQVPSTLLQEADKIINNSGSGKR